MTSVYDLKWPQKNYENFLINDNIHYFVFFQSSNNINGETIDKKNISGKLAFPKLVNFFVHADAGEAGVGVDKKNI